MENDLQMTQRGVSREIRFAVVMYGGVSLAIYINGIAQELLKMCRASVAERKTKNLKTTEKIYRQISCLLADEERLEQVTKLLADVSQIKDKQQRSEREKAVAAEVEDILEELIGRDDRPLTRLVVDILTGTSAGGINAVFLAKALVNNQDIDQLKELWLKEGDIGVLINDQKSVADINLNAPKQARSLLNSQRMYLKLLEAFDGMGRDAEDRSPLTDELDLFVPTTDFQGVTVPLRLLDDVVEEKRFRQVFHFRYGRDDGRNDFGRRNNPMLAFAARATSSFPFAFEPMRLSQAYAVIDEGFADARSKKENLQRAVAEFFPKVIKKDGGEIDWTERDLVDGGVLDNKPFGYAIDVLTERRADFQVERKLLYVEPSPENFSRAAQQRKGVPPDAIENAKASLTDIPGYETIREDLERVLERNRLIDRVNKLLAEAGKAEKDVYPYFVNIKAEDWRNNLTDPLKQNKDERPETGKEWEHYGLEAVIQWKGHAVLPYYRLRIASLTDDIARLVTRKIGVEEKSEYFAAIRNLVRVWRDENFSFYRENAGQTTDEKVREKETVLAFLRRFDLNYRLRRLRFVLQKSEDLFRFDKIFREELKTRNQQLGEIRSKARMPEENQHSKTPNADGSDETTPINEAQKAVIESFYSAEQKPSAVGSLPKAAETAIETKTPTEIIWELSGAPLDENAEIWEEKDKSGLMQLRLATGYLQNGLKKIFTDLQEHKGKLLSRRADSGELNEAINAVSLSAKDLRDLLTLTNEEISEDDPDFERSLGALAAKNPKIYEQINRAAAKLEEQFETVFDKARLGIDTLLKGKDNPLPGRISGVELNPVLVGAVRDYLWHYYFNFDDYDQISFPIFYQTPVGEAVKVDVMRISPPDAKSLIDEKGEKRQKLAGESLFHFGAFLDRVWRWNDIMWGRLDGAERLITALLSDQKYEALRRYLTKKIHLEILDEELLASNKEELQELLADSLVKTSAGLPMREVVEQVTRDASEATIKNKLSAVLGNCLDRESAYDYLKNHYSVEKRLEPKDLLRMVSRSTKVTGDIFESIAAKHGQTGGRLRWISRFGQIFWGLVEVAAPNSFWNLLFHHWLMLLYFFEIVLIVGSTIFVRPEVQQFGIVTLILTLIVHLAALTLHDYMRGGNLWYLLRFIALVLLFPLLIAGALFFYAVFFGGQVWLGIVDLQHFLSGYGIWQRLVPIALVAVLFLALLLYRFLRTKISLRKFYRRKD